MGRKRESHVSTLGPRDEVKLEGVKRAQLAQSLPVFKSTNIIPWRRPKNSRNSPATM